MPPGRIWLNFRLFPNLVTADEHLERTAARRGDGEVAVEIKARRKEREQARRTARRRPAAMSALDKVSAALSKFDITGQGTIFDAGGGAWGGAQQPSMSAPTTPAGRERPDTEHDVRRAKTVK